MPIHPAPASEIRDPEDRFSADSEMLTIFHLLEWVLEVNGEVRGTGQ